MHSEPVAVIAGAGPGLGAALCRQLSARGWTVVALARTSPESVAGDPHWHSPPGRTLAMECDVTDALSVERAFGEARRLGSVSLLVYNAGSMVRGPFLDLDASTFESAWRAGPWGAVLCAQQALRGMLDDSGGTLIFTGATASLRGGAGFAPFASSKFALRGLTQSLAREFGPRGVHVAHAVIDGIIDRGDGAAPSGDARLDPDAIARTYCALMDQEPSAWTHELDLRPDRERF
jgi:NAD(P)-dependent dehydrogenase (short-subunit alcohol dehydrogenase family)